MLFHVYPSTIVVGFDQISSSFVAVIATFISVFTIVIKSPITSVLLLIALFGSVSVYLWLADMPFLALSYLLVYVGAISILFLFILMLINVRISELLTGQKNSAVLAILVVLFFTYAMQDVLPNSASFSPLLDNTAAPITEQKQPHLVTTAVWAFYNLASDITAAVKSSNWDTSLVTISDISSIGNIAYSFLFIFQVKIGYIILLALVGAILITIKPVNLSNDLDPIKNTGYAKQSNTV